ncbi:equilibrative nucleoside transporter 1 [Lepeophtheirus salmonis]|uniref:equilibrative nucleoside transporter 1 n=1 Tax=Lepeophtheirus salmonis TaxID=72036 RepID=UPI003AF33FB2
MYGIEENTEDYNINCGYNSYPDNSRRYSLSARNEDRIFGRESIEEEDLNVPEGIGRFSSFNRLYNYESNDQSSGTFDPRSSFDIESGENYFRRFVRNISDDTYHSDFETYHPNNEENNFREPYNNDVSYPSSSNYNSDARASQTYRNSSYSGYNNSSTDYHHDKLYEEDLSDLPNDVNSGPGRSDWYSSTATAATVAARHHQFQTAPTASSSYGEALKDFDETYYPVKDTSSLLKSTSNDPSLGGFNSSNTTKLVRQQNIQGTGDNGFEDYRSNRDYGHRRTEDQYSTYRDEVSGDQGFLPKGQPTNTTNPRDGGNYNTSGSANTDQQQQLSWTEKRRLQQEEEQNFKSLSASMDRIDLEMNPPKDRLSLIYLTLILHGIGTQMSWNMFVTAKEQNRGDWFFMLSQYFVTYKLGKDYTNLNDESPYAMQFLQYFGYAAQVPNLILNWINIFLNWGENLTMRIVWTVLIEVIVFVITIVLAMVDSSNWPGLFFYLTMGSIVILNAANGIYHNTVYGIASKLPFRYTGAVILGSNISGIIVATINIISISISPNPRTAAIYYFITALFILLACFDTYFALPLNRFFRYHDYQYKKGLQLKKKSAISSSMGTMQCTNPTGVISSRTSSLVRRLNHLPFWTIFRKCLPQCFNIFFTFFVSLIIFPNVYAEVQRSDQTFFISKKYYSAITCFLTFNFGAMLGNLIATYVHFPSPRWLFAPVLLRALFIPFFALCNYRPLGVERIWPVMFHWDAVYWTGGAFFGLTGGYLSAIAIMYCPSSCTDNDWPGPNKLGLIQH